MAKTAEGTKVAFIVPRKQTGNKHAIGNLRLGKKNVVKVQRILNINCALAFINLKNLISCSLPKGRSSVDTTFIHLFILVDSPLKSTIK